MLAWLVFATLTAAPPVVDRAYETTSELTDPTAAVDLSGIWFFHAGDNPMFAQPSLDDRDWAPLRLPTTRVAYERRWQGYGWYRRHLYIDPRVLGNALMLSLGPAREVVEIYINGVLLLHRGRFGSRMVGDSRVLPLSGLVPNGILKSGENVLAIRVYDPSYTCGLPAGPLLIGAPDAVSQHIWLGGSVPLALRLSLALVALCIAVAQALTHAGRPEPRGESWWAAGAGTALAVVHLGGTGVLASLLPSLELAVRLPVAAQPLALLGLANYFAARYDDFDGRLARLGRYVLALLSAALFLAPDKLVFLAAGPISVCCALFTTLYGAHLMALAARRQEAGTLPLFLGLMGVLGMLIYDGLVPAASDAMPPWSAIGAVSLLGLASVIAARVGYHDYERTLLQMVRLQKQLDSRVWMDILTATAAAINQPQAFFDAVAHEIARQMEVRRCSIVLPDDHDNLYIAACKGLPKQARHKAINQARSIAHFVYAHGLSLTPATLPVELSRSADRAAVRQGNYDTQGFIAQPIVLGEKTLGVLNVSDRNNGGPFGAEDEATIATFAERLALVISKTHIRLEDMLRQEAVTEITPRLIKPAAEPKGRLYNPEAAPPEALPVDADAQRPPLNKILS